MKEEKRNTIEKGIELSNKDSIIVPEAKSNINSLIISSSDSEDKNSKLKLKSQRDKILIEEGSESSNEAKKLRTFPKKKSLFPQSRSSQDLSS